MIRATTQSQAVLLSAAFVGLGVSFLLTALLGRSLPAEAFGFVALVGTVFSLARELTDLGSSNVAAAQIAPEPTRERSVLEDLLALRLGLAALAAMACVALAATRGRHDEQGLLVFAALAILLQHLSAFGVVFLVRQALAAPAFLAVASQVAVLLASVALAAGGAAASLFAAVLVVREVVVSIGIAALGVRRIGYRPWPRLRAWAGSTLLRNASLYGLAALLYTITVQGAPLLVAGFCAPEALGAFAAAFRPMSPLLTLPWLIATPLAPAFALLYRSDPAGFVRRTAATVQCTVGAAAVIAIAGQDLAAPALALLYSGRFIDGPLSAVAVLNWLAVALGAVCVIAAVVVVLLAAGRVRAILGLAVTCLMINGLLVALLLPSHGFVGVAMALAVATVVVAMGACALALRHAAMPVALLPAFATLAPAAGLAFANQMMLIEGPARLVIGGLMSLSAVAAVWLICKKTNDAAPR